MTPIELHLTHLDQHAHSDGVLFTSDDEGPDDAVEIRLPVPTWIAAGRPGVLLLTTRPPGLLPPRPPATRSTP